MSSNNNKLERIQQTFAAPCFTIFPQLTYIYAPKPIMLHT